MAIIYAPARPVFAYGVRAGRFVVDDAGWHHAFDCDWKPLAHHSTEHRALHAFDQRMLQAFYPPTKTALLAELQEHGPLCIDPANLNRLARDQVSTLIGRWRQVRGEA